MATRLYFHDIVAPLVGTLPAATKSGATPDVTWATAASPRYMNTFIGVLRVFPNQASLAQTGAQSHYVRTFVSPAFGPGGQTITAGNISYNVANSESNLNANYWLDGLFIYVWRPSGGGSVVGTLFDNRNSDLGVEPTAGNSQQVSTWTATPSIQVIALEGDVIVCECWATFAQVDATSYNLSIMYDGNTVTTVNNTVVSSHAAFIEFALTLNIGGAAEYNAEQLVSDSAITPQYADRDATHAAEQAQLGPVFQAPQSVVTKVQFQPTESLKFYVGEFVDKFTGSPITGDTVTFTVVSPTPATTTVSGVYSATSRIWSGSVAVGSYVAGAWQILATSSNANALPQYLVLQWGDQTSLDIEFCRRAFKNRMKIDAVAKTETLYAENGVTVLQVWDLKDPVGAATATNIYEKVPV